MWWNSLRLVLHHTPQAGIAALLFIAGVLSAVPVLRWRVEFLLRMPRSFAGWLREIMDKRPSVLRLAAFIFSFNGTAILCYMLTGVLPGLPYVVAFWTGLNVALAGLLVRETGAPDVVARSPTRWERLCGILTFVLELPCFWYALGLGMTIRLGFSRGVRDLDWTSLADRVWAYALVILPVLALSALVEAYAVTAPYRPHPPEKPGGPPLA